MKDYSLALIEKPLDEGLTKSEINDLLDILSDTYVIPVEFQGECSATMGFIGLNDAEAIGYEYDSHSELGYFVANILNDMTMESNDCSYTHSVNGYELNIWISRQ